MRRPTNLTETEALRSRARRDVESGAVTQSYGADRETVVELLNKSLATEIVCWLRYMRHHYMAKGVNAEPVAAEFLEHANEERQHADELAARIVQLGGEPDFSPDGLTQRSHAEYVEGETLAQMIHENLVAERIAIEAYTEFVRFLGDKDPTTRTMLERILAKEEEHAEDMTTLRQSHAPQPNSQKNGQNEKREANQQREPSQPNEKAARNAAR